MELLSFLLYPFQIVTYEIPSQKSLPNYRYKLTNDENLSFFQSGESYVVNVFKKTCNLTSY